MLKNKHYTPLCFLTLQHIMDKKKKTYVINFISGPGNGKTTLSAYLFVKLKLYRLITEYIGEYAKVLVWKKDFDTLNNQYFVTKTQYDLLKQINGTVDIIVTDGPLLHGLYYNRHNKDNNSNIDKTEEFILKCYNEFNNINIFLERGKFEYEKQGRIQTEEESKEIDIILKHMLKASNIPFKSFVSGAENIDHIFEYVISIINKDKAPES
jgi:hypothetical protein